MFSGVLCHSWCGRRFSIQGNTLCQSGLRREEPASGPVLQAACQPQRFFWFLCFLLSLKGIAEIFSTSISLSQGGVHAQPCLSSWCRRGHWDLTEQESLELGPSSGPGVTARSPCSSCDQTPGCLWGLPNPIGVMEDSSVMAFH